MLADENIDPDVVAYPRSIGCDVLAVVEAGLVGADDRRLLRHATQQNRLVLTHDADFGRLAFADRESLVGVVYLRPGHIDPAFTIASVQILLAQELDVTPPFMIVVRRRAKRVHIRLRTLG